MFLWPGAPPRYFLVWVRYQAGSGVASLNSLHIRSVLSSPALPMLNCNNPCDGFSPLKMKLITSHSSKCPSPRRYSVTDDLINPRVTTLQVETPGWGETQYRSSTVTSPTLSELQTPLVKMSLEVFSDNPYSSKTGGSVL